MLVLFSPRRMYVFGVHVVDIDTASYDGRHPKILSRSEGCKKGKYFGSCLEQRHQFAPLVFSVYNFIVEDKKM